MKIVSVMTTDSRGGAEFAAVELLDALRARGHDTVMVTDQPGIGRETGVRRAADRDRAQALAWAAGRRLRCDGHSWSCACARRWSAEAPYDVLLLHYKKEQIMALALPRRLTEHARVGRVGTGAVSAAPGPSERCLSASPRDARRLVMAISAGTRESVCDVGVPRSKVLVDAERDANRHDPVHRRGTRTGARTPRAYPMMRLSSVASRAFTRRSATTSSSTRSPDCPDRPSGDGRRRRDGGVAAREGATARRPRPLHSDAGRRRRRGPVGVRRPGLLPQPHGRRAASGDPRDARRADPAWRPEPRA